VTTWNKLSELRRKWLALEGDDAVEIHGWLIGVAVAIERKRNANPAEADSLIAELRASAPPAAAEREVAEYEPHWPFK
jgi:hypothetical protein